MNPIRRLIAALTCRRKGHDIDCAIAVFETAAKTYVQRHVHLCFRCRKVTLDERKPITPGTRAMLADAGLPLEDQRSALLN